MPVRNPGTASSESSLVLAYSNSKPTMTRLMPAAKPRTERVFGSDEKPQKIVASAAAGRGVAAINPKASRPAARCFFIALLSARSFDFLKDPSGKAKWDACARAQASHPKLFDERRRRISLTDFNERPRDDLVHRAR